MRDKLNVLPSRLEDTSDTTRDAIDATTTRKKLTPLEHELPALLRDGHVVRRLQQVPEGHLVVVIARARFIWDVWVLIQRPARPEPFRRNDHDSFTIRLDVVVVGEVE